MEQVQAEMRSKEMHARCEKAIEKDKAVCYRDE